MSQSRRRKASVTICVTSAYRFECSYRSHEERINREQLKGWNGAGGRTRTDTLSPAADFESAASTNSATLATCALNIVFSAIGILAVQRVAGIISSPFQLASILLYLIVRVMIFCADLGSWYEIFSYQSKSYTFGR